MLTVGSGYEWNYGAGFTDATGLATMTSAISPSGPQTLEDPVTISVARYGTVTMDGDMATFQGFLSDAFHERNFGPEGLVSVSRMAAFDLELLTRLDGGGRAHPAYGRAIRSLTAEGAAHA